MKIINSHAHALRKPFEDVKGNLDDLKKDMEKGGIDTCMLFSSFGTDEVDYPIKELFELTKKDSRFHILYIVRIEKDLDVQQKQVEEYFKKGLIKGVKILLGYSHIYPEDKKLIPFYDLCEKYDYPVIFHTGDTYGFGSKVKYAHPLNIDSLAVDRPKLKIIMVHIGNPWVLDAAEIVYKNKNVYGDVSGFFLDFEDKRYVEFMKQQLRNFIGYAGGDKLLFGTDFPLADSVNYLKMIEDINLTKKEKELLFHGNAEALFKIK